MLQLSSFLYFLKKFRDFFSEALQPSENFRNNEILSEAVFRYLFRPNMMNIQWNEKDETYDITYAQESEEILNSTPEIKLHLPKNLKIKSLLKKTIQIRRTTFQKGSGLRFSRPRDSALTYKD